MIFHFYLLPTLSRWRRRLNSCIGTNPIASLPTPRNPQYIESFAVDGIQELRPPVASGERTR
jgi:hypothetical protein